MLSLVGKLIHRSRFFLAVAFELGGESPVLLLPVNSSSLGHLDVMEDRLGEECMGVVF